MKEQWLSIFNDLKNKGKVSSPRGLKILEIEDYYFYGDINNKLCSFEERNLSLKYLIGEMAWYFSASANDPRMESYSSFWKTIKNKEIPYYYSNYGRYFYNEKQFEYVINSLLEDKDSRQACIILNNKDIMMSNSKDKVCTYSVSFRIRENKLNMSINMRSNDFIFGTCIDYFQFTILYELIFNFLKEKYSDLSFGTYFHKVDSFHIYERHFHIMEEIVKNNGENFKEIKVPNVKNKEEALFLKKNFAFIEDQIRKNGNHIFEIDKSFNFTNWSIKQLI